MRLIHMMVALNAALFAASIADAEVGSEDGPAPIFDVANAGKWGLVDANGKVVLPLQYDDIFERRDRNFQIRKDGLVAVVDRSGSEIVPFKYTHIYELADLSGDPKMTGFGQAKLDGQSLVIDRRGHPILGPGLGDVSLFNGTDQFIVRDGRQYGVVSLDCDWTILPAFQDLGSQAPNGLARARAMDRRSGFINGAGNWVIEPGWFEDVGEFSDDGWAQAKAGGKWGFIDATGQWMIEPISEEQYWRPPAFNDRGYTVITIAGQKGVMNRAGEWVIFPAYDYIFMEHDDTFLAKLGNQTLHLSSDGTVLGTTSESEIGGGPWFDEHGLARVVTNGKALIIDRSGNEVLGSQFDNIGAFSTRNWAPAQKGSKWGAVNIRGEWVLQPDYDCVVACRGPANVSAPPSFTTARPEPVTTPDLTSPRYADPKSQKWCRVDKTETP